MEYVLEGIVVEGDHRGRQLGYPTANVEQEEEPALADGVYAGFVERADGSFYLSAISLGRRLTFHDATSPRLVEAYLLDFDDDLYGERLRVTVTNELRSQRRFESVDELIEQIRQDVEAVRALLGARDRITPN
ncbi:MAG TPA: riboflavin kinase [Acidimicrobiales bacterium]|nr:riboflavin kinase [Acidimicrobiales bacterium]